MLNEDMEHAARPLPVLPESLRQAVRDAEATGRRAEERAHLAMPFRARLRARDAVRPQSTLSILANVDRLGGARLAAPPTGSGTHLPAVLPASFGTGPGGGSGGDDERPGVGPRITDVSQFAFAGLAVLGLAGLSLMAAESALSSDAEPAGSDEDRLAGAQTGVDAVMASAALPATARTTPAASIPWFDYRSTANDLQARIAAFQETERRVARARDIEAERVAAASIAETEALRLAEAASAGTASVVAASAASAGQAVTVADQEAARLAEAEAQRVAATARAEAAAKVEAMRLAGLEADRLAAAQLEAGNLAKLRAAQAAEAETRRLADLEARRLSAEAEVKRLAALDAMKVAAANEAKRLAALETRRAADAEAKRLAASDAATARKAAEAKLVADLAARRAAEMEVQRVAAAAAVSPKPASRKPARPDAPVVQASLTPAVKAKPVKRAAPAALKAGKPEVRSFVPAAPAAIIRDADEFLAERVQRTAISPVSAASLEGLKAEFVRLAASSADGSRHTLKTPDGRELAVTFEQTVPVDAARANVRTVDYRATPAAVTRTYAQPPRVAVSVMCRDVAYAFPGQERGRFAACESADGSWTLARASELDGRPV